MDRRRFAISILGLASFGNPAPAMAGSLDPTSKDTVSISVTIPPRLHAEPLPDRDGEIPETVEGVCLVTNGLDHVRMILLRDGEARSTAGITPTSAGALDCGRQPGGRALIRDFAADHRMTAPPNGPLTLLIIPD